MDISSKRVLKNYRKSASYEWERLFRDQYHQLEFDTTFHFLMQHLPRRGLILDAGGGPGRYTIELAKLGYDIVLFDLTPELLDIARVQVKKAGVQERVKDYVCGSVHDLSGFESASFDAVLCLGGPLNHLVNPARREKAIDELVRVARKNSPIFISVIGRLANLNLVLQNNPEGLERYPGIYRKILRTGDYDGSIGFAPCHFYLLEELEKSLKKRRLRILNEVGLQGLTPKHPKEIAALAKKYPKGWKTWKELHLESCTHPAVVASSENILIVCRK